MAYDKYVEPIGDVRADLQAALIASVVLNVNRDTKRHPQPAPITDFLLDFDPPEPAKAKDWRALRATVKNISSALGGGDPLIPQRRVVLTDAD